MEHYDDALLSLVLYMRNTYSRNIRLDRVEAIFDQDGRYQHTIAIIHRDRIGEQPIYLSYRPNALTWEVIDKPN